MKPCPECNGIYGYHMDWCSIGRCWLPEWLKRLLWYRVFGFVLALFFFLCVVIFTVSASAAPTPKGQTGSVLLLALPVLKRRCVSQFQRATWRLLLMARSQSTNESLERRRRKLRNAFFSSNEHLPVR